MTQPNDQAVEAEINKIACVIIRRVQFCDFGKHDSDGSWTCTGAQIDLLRDVCTAAAKDIYAALPHLTQPAPAAETGGWQPIETAPKDGTIVDLWTPGGRRCDYQWKADVLFTSGCWCAVKRPTEYSYLSMGEVTHWRPLPALPGALDTAKWRSVPLEPTKEMLAAGYEALAKLYPSKNGEKAIGQYVVYEAMVSAAPAPPGSPATPAPVSAEAKWLGNLLAVIHRDGGHHQDRVGTAQAVEDAHQIWACQQTQLTAALAEIEKLRKALRITHLATGGSGLLDRVVRTALDSATTFLARQEKGE